MHKRKTRNTPINRVPPAHAMRPKTGRTRENPIPPGAVAEHIEAMFTQIIALDDIARRYAHSPYTSLTMEAAINALVQDALRELHQATWLLKPSHPARTLLDGAERALQSLSVLLDEAYDDSTEGSITPASHLGALLLQRVHTAGQAVEGALRAAGGAPCSDYLDGQSDPCVVLPREGRLQ